MAKKSEEEKLREDVSKAYQILDDKIAKYRDHVARSRIPSIEKNIIEIKKKDPGSSNIHFLRNSLDILKSDLGVTEKDEQDKKLGLHAECVYYKEKSQKSFEALYRSLVRTQKGPELHKQNIEHNKEL